MVKTPRCPLCEAAEMAHEQTSTIRQALNDRVWFRAAIDALQNVEAELRFLAWLHQTAPETMKTWRDNYREGQHR